MTTTVQQHLTAFSFHPPFINISSTKKDKTNSHRTTKILNINIENIVVSSVLESIKGIQRNKLFIKKGQPIKTSFEKTKIENQRLRSRKLQMISVCLWRSGRQKVFCSTLWLQTWRQWDLLVTIQGFFSNIKSLFGFKL